MGEKLASTSLWWIRVRGRVLSRQNWISLLVVGRRKRAARAAFSRKLQFTFSLPNEISFQRLRLGGRDYGRAQYFWKLHVRGV